MKLALAFAIFISTATYAADKPTPPPKPLPPPQQQMVDPAKLVPVTLSVADWQAIVSSMPDSGSVSARDAKRIGRSIADQVNQQFVPPPSAQSKK